MQFIDTHIHLQDVMSSNATDIIRTAIQKGCEKMVCVATQEADWVKIAALTDKFGERIVPAFGIHPWYVQNIQSGWEDRLQAYLDCYPQALIGECGLDGLKPDIKKQKAIFAKHIEIALTSNRPLIVHTVKAVPLMEDFWAQMPDKFVIHGFNGKREFLQNILRHNGFVGVGFGLLKTSKAGEILSQIPADRLLLETDAPFQANSPNDIQDLIEQIALLCHKDKNLLATQVYQNSLEFIK